MMVYARSSRNVEVREDSHEGEKWQKKDQKKRQKTLLSTCVSLLEEIWHFNCIISSGLSIKHQIITLLSLSVNSSSCLVLSFFPLVIFPSSCQQQRTLDQLQQPLLVSHLPWVVPMVLLLPHTLELLVLRLPRLRTACYKHLLHHCLLAKNV